MYLILVGPPGSGKTRLLKALGLILQAMGVVRAISIQQNYPSTVVDKLKSGGFPVRIEPLDPWSVSDSEPQQKP